MPKGSYFFQMICRSGLNYVVVGNKGSFDLPQSLAIYNLFIRMEENRVNLPKVPEMQLNDGNGKMIIRINGFPGSKFCGVFGLTPTWGHKRKTKLRRWIQRLHRPRWIARRHQHLWSTEETPYNVENMKIVFGNFTTSPRQGNLENKWTHFHPKEKLWAAR